jgi:putative inorganic carbon (HCO3(-)) transporter
MRISRINKGRKAPAIPGVPVAEEGSRTLAFVLFCAFLVSYFLHFTARVPLLAKVHFDLILAGATALAVALAPHNRYELLGGGRLDPVARRLWILVGYIIVTLPFVEWPGSTLRNLEPFAKSLCFFFFVLATVDTTRKFKVLLAVYVFTQLWRVLEPLVMHIKSGYWGSFTSLGNWEYMDRLAGAPSDIINPNGLGFVIIMTLPLLQFLIKPDTLLRRALWITVACAMCYALVLSASRSGFLAFVFLCLFVSWRSKHRAALLAGLAVAGVVGVLLMTGLQRERYISIYSHDAPGAATAQERIQGVIGDFKVSLRRPLFGHGLGTSREANAHFRGADRLSHDLYTETAEELGYVGLVLLLALIWSFLRACRTAQQRASATATDERLQFLHNVAASLVAVVAVDLFFSFAAFGLSEPYWYFVGGLAVVTERLATALAPAPATATGSAPARGRLPLRRSRKLHPSLLRSRSLMSGRARRSTPQDTV